jgi:hypothetical protein
MTSKTSPIATLKKIERLKIITNLDLDLPNSIFYWGKPNLMDGFSVISLPKPEALWLQRSFLWFCPTMGDVKHGRLRL